MRYISILFQVSIVHSPSTKKNDIVHSHCLPHPQTKQYSPNKKNKIHTNIIIQKKNCPLTCRNTKVLIFQLALI